MKSSNALKAHKSITVQSSHKSAKSSDKERSRRGSSQAKDPKWARRPSAEKIRVQYGPISRRLNSVATPVSFEKFRSLHEQQAHKLRRDLNQLDAGIDSKQKTLEKLRKELARVQNLNAKTMKFSSLARDCDKALDGGKRGAKATHSIEERYLLDLRSSASGQDKKDKMQTRRPNSAMPARPLTALKSKQIGSVEAATARKKSAVARNGQRSGQTATENKEEGDPLDGNAPGYMRRTLSRMYGYEPDGSLGDLGLSEEEDVLDDKINIDEGIAIKDYKPSHLLEKKVTIIRQIKDSRLNYLRELFTVHQYQHVLLRMETDYKYEMVILRELDPYFNFQDKIKGTLNDISTGKEQRQKMFEQKIRQIKYQLSEKQYIMQQDLRCKCKELAALQKYNKKKAKSKTPRDRDNMSDSHSVSGSTTYYAKSNMTKARDASERKSEYTRYTKKNATSVQDSPSQTPEEKENQSSNLLAADKPTDFEINLENAEELNDLTAQCDVMKMFYDCHKKINEGEDEEASFARMAMIREHLKQSAEDQKDFKEKTLRIQAVLTAKPPKAAKVAFMLTSTKAHLSRKLSEQYKDAGNAKNNLEEQVTKVQSERQARLALMQETQDEAHNIFKGLKEKLETLMTKPQWLLTMEGKLIQDDTDKMIHELNEDILFKQEKSLLLDKAESGFVDENSGRFDDRGVPTAFGEASKPNLHQTSPKKMTFKEKNDTAIRDLRQSLQKLKMDESSPVRRSRTTVGAQGKKGLQGKERGSQPSSQSSTHNEMMLQQELEERLLIQDRIQEEERKLHEFELLEEMRNNYEEIAKIYNDRLARDAILDLEHVDLNESRVKKKQEREQLQQEIQRYAEAERVNAELRIDHKSFEERERKNAVEEQIEDEAEVIKVQEQQLLQKALSKYQDQRMQAAKARSKGRAELEQHLLKQGPIKDYDIELIFKDHREFKHLTDVIRQIHDRIRLQCKESTNAFAFRIHCVLDVAKIKCPSEDMRTIIRRHKKYWPYTSLAHDRADKDGLGPRTEGDKDLQNLLAIEETQRLTRAQKRQLEAAKKKLQQERQEAFEAPQELDNKEIIGNVLKQLVETRLQFVHQKFILNYLVFQSKQLKKELKIRDASPTPSMTETLSYANSPMANTNRKSRHARQQREGGAAKAFGTQYKAVMEVHQQNYRNVRFDDGADADQRAQEELLQLQLLQAEDRHHEEGNINYKEDEKRRIEEREAAKRKKKNRYQFVELRVANQVTGPGEIARRVNQDKRNFGTLAGYNMRDTEFIQDFMEEARRQQKSELLQIPELEVEAPDPRKALEKLTKPTMSAALKRKGNQEEVKTRREIIAEKRLNQKPTLRFELPSPVEKRKSKDTTRQQLLKRSRSSVMSSRLSNKTMQDTLLKSKSHKQFAGAKQATDGGKDKFRIRKIQAKRQSDAQTKSSYGRIEQELSKKIQDGKQYGAGENTNNQLHTAQASQRLNADLPTPGKSSILKKRKGSVQFEELGRSSKILVPALNMKLDPSKLSISNDAEIEKAVMASSVNSPGRFLATITDEEEDTIASKQRASDQLYMRARRQPSKEWYLAASDEEYSLPGDPDHKTVANTINTSSHHGNPTLAMSSRQIGITDMNLAQTAGNAFFTDRNRPTSATSNIQVNFNRPLKITQKMPAYQTSAHFFDPDNVDARTLHSYHSQNSLQGPPIGPMHVKKNTADTQPNKIKIKKIKLPKLKKNKELSNMIKDL